VRAGFRRTLAVRNLGWHDIPATILPSDMPPSEEHWINIIENASREKLSTYELALAARNMRDKFGTSISEFARKTCHPPSYINDLLGCLERLPEEVLNSWAYNDRVPFSIYVKLSVMTPLEAIRNLRLWRGQHRIDDAATLATKALDRRRVRNHENDKILTVKGIERTQRLMVAIQTSTLAPDTKRLAVEIVEYLQGCRKRVDGIIHDGWRLPPAPPTEDLEFEMMMEAKIRQLQKENTGDTTPRRNDEDNL
jgi:ParB-like chromosome segregation protein Spo0J